MQKTFSAIALLAIAFVLGGSQSAVAQTPFYTQTNLISDDKSVNDASSKTVLWSTRGGLHQARHRHGGSRTTAAVPRPCITRRRMRYHR